MTFRKWMAILTLVLALLLFAVLVLLLYPAHREESGEHSDPTLSLDLHEHSTEEHRSLEGKQAQDSVSTLRMIWGGDVLLHDNMLTAGLADQEEQADFSFLLQNIKGVFSQADLNVVDMEGTLGEPPFQAYPLFHAPRSVARFLRAAGVDVAVTANNHCLDAWGAGLGETKQALEAEGIPAIGTASKPGEQTWRIFEVAGMRVGLTAFTYETAELQGRPSINGLPVPEGLESCIDSFSYEPDRFDADCERMKKRVEHMRSEGAQFVAVFLHWGTEYDSTPSEWQRRIAHVLADAGADVILACGPHVVQPVETVWSSDGSHRMLVFYSVGNLVSAQYFDTGASQGRAEDGLLAMLEIRAQGDQPAEIVAAGYTPLYCYKPALRGGAGSTAVPIGLGLREPDRVQGCTDLLEASLQRIRAVLNCNQVEGIPWYECLEGNWMSETR